jgi:serine O-acetyltransferase
MNAPLRTNAELSTSTQWGLDEIVRDLHSARDQWRQAHQRNLESGGREFPSRDALRDIVERLCGALFLMRLGPQDLPREALAG